MEARSGVVPEKRCDDATSSLAHNPLGVGSNPTGGISKYLIKG